MELVLEMIHLIASWVNRADPELGSAPNHQPPSLGGGSSREKDSLIYWNKESARLCSYTKMHLNKTSNRMDDRPLFSANTLQAELSSGLELAGTQATLTSGEGTPGTEGLVHVTQKPSRQAALTSPPGSAINGSLYPQVTGWRRKQGRDPRPREPDGVMP